MAMTYDIPARLQKNAFDREGYVFQGWSYKKEAVTPDFTDRQEVLNLVEEEQQEISLYAVWEPRVYKITANQQRGSGGTEAFFEKFGIGWYGNRETTQAITGITIPARAGYDFRGYHTGIAGLGEKIVNGSGKILAPATRFVENNVIYAYWVPKNYTIIFDKQGGSGGSDRAAAAYQKALPLVDSKGAKLWAPTRKGYTFQGYYTEADGRGSQYYTAYMSGNRNYSLDRDLTLYAYWVDEEPPEVTMSQTPGIPVTTGVEAEAQGWTTEWSKSPVKLTVAAKDAGSGVDAVFLYVKGTDGRYVPAKDSSGRDMAFTGLSSSAPCHTYQFEYVKPTEGVVNYMALAIDGAGHSSPACYLTVKTDYTPPRGTVTDNAVNENGDGIWELEGKMWNIELDLWDYKVQ